MALTSITTAEELHAMGEAGARRVRRWLNFTGRFDISHTIYDRHPQTGELLDHCRVATLDGRHQNFDLAGIILGPGAEAADRIYIECKDYSSDGNQGTLYRQYLAVCYSSFHKRWKSIEREPAEQYMWATTHPFLVSRWTDLCSVDLIRESCLEDRHKAILGEQEFDPDTAEKLASRLWICVVNDRIEEMMMGPALYRNLKGAMAGMSAS